MKKEIEIEKTVKSLVKDLNNFKIDKVDLKAIKKFNGLAKKINSITEEELNLFYSDFRQVLEKLIECQELIKKEDIGAKLYRLNFTTYNKIMINKLQTREFTKAEDIKAFINQSISKKVVDIETCEKEFNEKLKDLGESELSDVSLYTDRMRDFIKSNKKIDPEIEELVTSISNVTKLVPGSEIHFPDLDEFNELVLKFNDKISKLGKDKLLTYRSDIMFSYAKLKSLSIILRGAGKTVEDLIKIDWGN